MVEFDLSKITGREPPTDDGLPCACEWNAAGEPVGLCAAHQSKLDDELAALRALLGACAPYLKEGETPAERIERERKDVTAMVGALARERTLLDQARKGLAEQAEVTSRVIAVITEARPYLESFAQLSRHPTAPDDVRKLLARLRELTHPSAGGVR